MDALADVRNLDGALKNGVITQDSLSAGLVSRLTVATAGLVTEAVSAKDGAVAAARVVGRAAVHALESGNDFSNENTPKPGGPN